MLFQSAWMQCYTMSNDKKFHIRIKFNPKDLKTELPHQQPEPNYIYHWPRIIATVVLIFGIIGSGVYYFNHNATTSIQTLKQSTLIAPQKKTELSISVKTLHNDTDKIIDKVEQAQSSNNEITITQTSPENKTAITVINDLSKSATTATPLNEKQPPREEISQLSNDPSITSLSNQIQPEKNKASPIFTQKKIEIFSSQIKRFVIAKNIKDKEPVGSLEDIQFDDNNIATIYAYSDAIGFTDQFLYYEWRLNGQRVAMIEIGVWGDRWRSYTRKFIQPNKRGDWSIILKNEVGDKLAIAEFTY